MFAVSRAVLAILQVRYMNQVLDTAPSHAPSSQGRQGLGLEFTNQRSVSSVLTGPSDHHDLRPQEIADAGLKVCSSPLLYFCLCLHLMQHICLLPASSMHMSGAAHEYVCWKAVPSVLFWNMSTHPRAYTNLLAYAVY